MITRGSAPDEARSGEHESATGARAVHHAPGRGDEQVEHAVAVHIAEAVGVEAEGLSRHVRGDRAEERVLLFEHYGKAAIRKGDMKLVRLGYRKPWELYDIKKDRSELNDLSQEKPELAKELAELFEKEAKRTLIYPLPGAKKKK